MTNEPKSLRQWGINFATFMAGALRPLMLIVFIALNWDNILPVMGFVTHFFTQLLGGYDYLNDQEERYLFQAIEKFIGSGIFCTLCYCVFDQALKHIPFFTFEGDKRRLAQEEANRIKFYEVRRNTLTLETIELYKTQHEKDRLMISEFREEVRNLKLEIEALRANKLGPSNKLTSEDAPQDLFKERKLPSPKRATKKRFVPRPTYKKKPPEF